MISVFWWRKPEYPEETTDLRKVTHVPSNTTVTQVAAHILELLDARDNVRHIPGFCYSVIVLMIEQQCTNK